MRNRLDAGATSFWQNRLRVPSGREMPSTQGADLLETYLANTRCTLKGLTEAEKDAVVAEVRQHLLASSQAREELGGNPSDALQAALVAFGQAQSTGANFSLTYQTTGAAKTEFPRAAMVYALPRFVFAMGAACLLVFLAVWAILLVPLAVGGRIANTYDALITAVIVLVFPALVGRHVGRQMRTNRPTSGVFFALIALVLLTIPLLPLSILQGSDSHDDLGRGIVGLIPALFVVWIPTAMLACRLTEVAIRHKAPRLHRA